MSTNEDIERLKAEVRVAETLVNIAGHNLAHWEKELEEDQIHLEELRSRLDNMENNNDNN